MARLTPVVAFKGQFINLRKLIRREAHVRERPGAVQDLLRTARPDECRGHARIECRWRAELAGVVGRRGGMGRRGGGERARGGRLGVGDRRARRGISRASRGPSRPTRARAGTPSRRRRSRMGASRERGGTSRASSASARAWRRRSTVSRSACTQTMRSSGSSLSSRRAAGPRWCSRPPCAPTSPRWIRTARGRRSTRRRSQPRAHRRPGHRVGPAGRRVSAETA